MTAPAYSTDLQNAALAESGETWGEPAGATGGGVPSAETDYFIQQAACMSKTMAVAGGTTGGMGTLAASPFTITSPNAIFYWHFFSCIGVLDSLTNGGVRCIAGQDASNYRHWYVRGKETDTYQSQWVCIPVNPNVAYQNTQGTPSGVWQYFGVVCKTLATVSKGNPFGTDAIRIGRTLQCIYGALADGYATFIGAAAALDAIAAALVAPGTPVRRTQLPHPTEHDIAALFKQAHELPPGYSQAALPAHDDSTGLWIGLIGGGIALAIGIKVFSHKR